MLFGCPPLWAMALYQSIPSFLARPTWSFLEQYLAFGFLFLRGFGDFGEFHRAYEEAGEETATEQSVAEELPGRGPAGCPYS